MKNTPIPQDAAEETEGGLPAVHGSVSSFRAGSGMLGATEPGQKVTAENIGALPPGSVVRLNDGGRVIHLHDDLWLWCCDHAWCYDTVDRHYWRLKEGATLCHIPQNTPDRPS